MNPLEIEKTRRIRKEVNQVLAMLKKVSQWARIWLTDLFVHALVSYKNYQNRVRGDLDWA